MGRYLLSRLGAAVPTLILLTLAAFILNIAARGDPAEAALRQGGQEPTAEAIAALRHDLGLDDPIPVQYVRWVGGLVQGDLGRSYIANRDVSDMIGERIGPTLRLGLSALAVTILVGIGLGIVFGLQPNSPVDVIGRWVALLVAAMPSFWLGLLLITLVAQRVPGLSVGGYGGFGHLVLPVIALSCAPAASLMRFTRGAMIETWRQDYVRTARAKGLGSLVVVLRHAIPNAILPVLTLLGLRFGQILAGAIVIETIFSWPGMGSVLLQAISGRDFPVIGAYVVLVGITFVVINLLTDVSYALIDPRIRLGGKRGY
jgi:peptide/nickel transport system permease protein